MLVSFFLLSFLVYSSRSHHSFPPSCVCFHPLLLFVHLHPLNVSSLLDSFPLSPPPTLSLTILPRPSLSTLSLPTLSYFSFISTPCMCPLCLILLYIIPSHHSVFLRLLSLVRLSLPSPTLKSYSPHLCQQFYDLLQHFHSCSSADKVSS